MFPKDILSPILQYGFAGAFAVTLATLIWFVVWNVKNLSNIIKENTEAYKDLASVIGNEDKKTAEIKELLVKMRDNLLQRPCQKDK